jgi:FkbM family methyltransferase
MNVFERWCKSIRHLPWLDRHDWVWNRVRPFYDRVIEILSPNGLRRNINGTDCVLVLPKCRWVQEVYEPEVWRHLMGQVKPGDIVADVGAYIGLYTIAVGKRIGPKGRVVAFEPNPENFHFLKEHVRLNGLADRVELFQAAVGSSDGSICLKWRGSESYVQLQGDGQPVPAVCLDTLFANRRLDVLKVDVEGYEEEVLRGAVDLLRDERRGPRLIVIEVHPYAWGPVGTTGKSLLGLLESCRYSVTDLDGKPVNRLASYGHILAWKQQ